MGHRCSFAIKAGVNVELFYGHWSALQLPDQLFWGPKFVERFIRGHEKVDWWLDDVWAEGCVGLDKDQKLILVYEGASDLSEAESDYFFELMGALWKSWGWEVQRVTRMEDIAVHMGYPAEEVIWVPEAEEPCELHLNHIQRAWPKWQVDIVLAGAAEHFQLIGSETPKLLTPRKKAEQDQEDVRARVLEGLRKTPNDPHKWFEGVMSKLGGVASESAKRGPPEVYLTQRARRKLINRALSLRGD